ncbi:MAG TPA: ribonuclease P protein component [Thermoanaerobaculia bacterium]
MNPSPVGGESFSRDDRLRKRREFQECYATGVRVSGRLFQMFLLRREASGKHRLGISVPRKAGSAVVRNRLRRRFREIFRRNREALPAGACDVLIHVRPGASRAPLAQLRDEYMSALSRVHPQPRRR